VDGPIVATWPLTSSWRSRAPPVGASRPARAGGSPAPIRRPAWPAACGTCTSPTCRS